MSSISYLSRHEIDDKKWDLCIKDADNGLIYAHSFFLDNMAGDWDAMIWNDYEAVMPLVWRRKFGIYYLYQPFFAAQLGAFGKNLSPLPLESFLKNIPKKFRYCDIDLNEKNQLASQYIEGSLNKMQFASRVTYFLPPVISGHSHHRYHRLARRMIHKANDEKVKINKQSDPHKIVSFYREQYALRHAKIDDRAFARLTRTAGIAMESGQCHLYEALINDITIAVYLVLSDKKNFYSVLGGSSDQGRNSGAFYALTDAAICDAGESGKIFRFEGSDIPGIASFNAQFGATTTNYLHAKYNNLPLIIRWIK